MIKPLDLKQVITIVGNTKNAGKTTVLNAIVKHDDQPCILTSIGLDGEDLDQVTHLEKPKVYVKPKDLVVTAFEALKHFTASYRIIKTYEIGSSLGHMVLCEIIKPGKVLLAGPSKVLDMQKVVRELSISYPYHIYIDGAFFRQSFAYIGDEVILVIGANYAPMMEATTNNAVLNYWRLTLPQLTDEYPSFPNDHITAIKGDEMIDFGFESLLGKSRDILKQTKDIDALYIPKALTDEFIDIWTNEFHHHQFDLICQSGVHIQLNDQNLKRLKQLTTNIYVIHPIHVRAVCINPYSPRGYTYPQQTFKANLSKRLGMDVINVEKGDHNE